MRSRAWDQELPRPSSAWSQQPWWGLTWAGPAQKHLQILASWEDCQEMVLKPRHVMALCFRTQPANKGSSSPKYTSSNDG